MAKVDPKISEKFGRRFFLMRRRSMRKGPILLVFAGFLFLFSLVSCGGNDGATSPFADFSAPVAEFAGAPAAGRAPLTVAFSDLSTGAISSWSWNFGDGGTSTEQNPSHDFLAAGVYTVSLTVTGPDGSNTNTKADYITVTPFADFSASPTSGPAPLTVAFTDTSTGTPTSWSWDFGDNSTSTLQNPSHEYTVPGTYDVTLTADGPGGLDSITKVGYITVTIPAPVAQFSGTPLSGNASLDVQFTDNSTGVISTWSWDFGDGSALDPNQNPSHTYTAEGFYTVSLTVTGP
ncbi:MAG TPA: PKD domain-containing protein, partial [Candidatus Aquicultoraceae bacterium]|nr:PKD domain-containing protein [Candidatus Aquicultoraceae bacterium]